MFGLFKKSYPVITPAMLQPADAPISTADAKRLFKQIMKEIGYLEKDELSLHAGYLSDEIKEQEQYLKAELVDVKQRVTDDLKLAKAEAKELATHLAKTTDPTERTAIEEDISFNTGEQQEALSELRKAEQAYESFKADKRVFLVEYINRQVHGTSAA